MGVRPGREERGLSESDDPCGSPGPCGPTSANTPPCGPYACTLAAQLQFVIDGARRFEDLLGFNPYEVALVWQKRDKGERTWREDLRLVLQPVEVLGLDEVAVVIGENGQYKDGTIELRQISPQQISNERTLQGWRDGVNWAESDNDREFFYEVVHARRCPGDPPAVRHRFTPAATPMHYASDFEWRIKLKPQIVERVGDERRDVSVQHPKHKRPIVST